MPKNGVLVTGGAGYIGSHALLLLAEAGERVITLDDLSTGFRQAVTCGELIEGNCGDAELVNRVLAEYRIDTVLHFAGSTIVPESIESPLKYYGNNSCTTRSLLECCKQAGVKHFVFSSTAAVYGTPAEGKAWETTATKPINPYGSSKLVSEWMLRDLAVSCTLRFAALRYFNVAGADPEGRTGQSTAHATHLTKVACEAAVGRRDSVTIFGTDYPTADGTGVRDYIHVSDLAAAHVLALSYLRSGGDSISLNCGYGHGYSVRQVLAAVERANGAPLRIQEAERRPGDPACLVAGTELIRTTFGWTPRYDDLDVIARSALDWERRCAQGS